ncbi:hypothetical protein Micbo1qcDRAFT_207480 [Microdochium bolleyi]|uniref:Extracellular membrane protein CFEM domain-containing protein n=1 Tax=Microdochium bolleyi TaxID=196109 RepID=A0A136ITU8_9PEZI|nr:hypothetical protein Micbo1qcDRAFT_207480 [Microdochium bolleyi]
MLSTQLVVATFAGVALAKCGVSSSKSVSKGPTPVCTTTLTTPVGPSTGCVTRCAETLISDGAVTLPCGCSTLSFTVVDSTTACPTNTACVESHIAFGTFTVTEQCYPTVAP